MESDLERRRAVRAMKRAAIIRAVLCAAAIVSVAVGAGLVYLPAGLMVGGLLVYLDCQRTHR